jgi:hypothetical protein
MHMKRLEVILIMALSVFLTGCHKTAVKYTDMRTAPTATISNGMVTISLPSSFLGSNTWVQAKSRFEGQTLCVSGYRTTSEPEVDHEYVVKLPASVSPQSLAVIWIDPDGSRVPVPTTK